jgi:hypothetical protein
MVRRDRLRHHLADRRPGQPGQARRHARSLGHRRPAALGPRRDLRRGPLPDPHRQRPRVMATLRNLAISIPAWQATPASLPPCSTTPGDPAGPYRPA